MGTARRGKKGDLDLARCSERIYFFALWFLSARWLPVRPRPVASVEFTMDVTNCAGIRDGYATSAHYAVTNFCR